MTAGDLFGCEREDAFGKPVGIDIIREGARHGTGAIPDDVAAKGGERYRKGGGADPPVAPDAEPTLFTAPEFVRAETKNLGDEVVEDAAL